MNKKDFSFMPRGSRLKFTGRMSKKSSEEVEVSLPQTFLDKFCHSMEVVVCDEIIGYRWGYSNEQQKHIRSKTISITPDNPEGGSVIPQVRERLKKELLGAYSVLENDKGYETLIIEL